MAFDNDHAAPVLYFELGTVVLQGGDVYTRQIPCLKWDERTRQWRAPALHYRDIILFFHNNGLPLSDKARGYAKIDAQLKNAITPREHQQKALDAWIKDSKTGVVSLPTGAGKTILAVLAVEKTQRPALIVVPTIDLLLQWQNVLRDHFSLAIGGLGGGMHDIKEITVSTYDSATLFIESIGNKFGLLIFDECHHLPAPQYQKIALASIAPFRLGLSATVERSDGKEELIYQLVGDMVYEGYIHQMEKDVLAPYDVVSIQVPLTDNELKEYKDARQIYVSFLRKNSIAIGSPSGWQEFVYKSVKSPDGQDAMAAYQKQKKLAQGAEGKIGEIWNLLRQHAHDRVIIFTNDNDLAYRIGCEFVLPVLTHKTKTKERKRFLEAFREGGIGILVTSKVLNEGVDVPEANVGIVVSGSGAVREHVQRLGRILRHRPNKRAVLYEIISKDTGEYFVNQRRRQHYAYQGSAKV